MKKPVFIISLILTGLMFSGFAGPKKKAAETPAAPQFYISTERENEYDDDDTELIDHRFEQIHIEYDGDDYEDLEEALDYVNKEITNGESMNKGYELQDINKLSSKELKQRKKLGFFPFKEEWNIYVRRTDNNILSLVREYLTPGEEGDYVEFEGYTFLMDSGEQLELSDIVDDEDAFYDMLERELSVLVTNHQMVYMGDYDIDLVDVRPAMDERLDEHRYSWVLDPQGLTFWFNDINALEQNTCVTVLFSDDTDGTVFNKKYVKLTPDEWIMQIPGNYSETDFDCEEDGITDIISWIAADTTDDAEIPYPYGINVTFDHRYYNVDEICTPSGLEWENHKAMLVHRDKKTVLLVSHDEDIYSYIDSFTLGDDNVEFTDYILGALAWPDSSVGYGTYVPTDVSAIRVQTVLDAESAEDMDPEYLDVSSDGTMTVTKDKKDSSSDQDKDKKDSTKDKLKKKK
ncbi:MAG: hypothetical protein K6G22_10670 [Lachnospiraceae bacterium]|nr:hypothetical protein [Lachnospiraceae bacterium]